MSESSESSVISFRWVGSEAAYLDQPVLAECGRIVIGRYGGNTTSGAHTNEDGALVWCDAGGAWEFAALLDAHFSAESAELILATLERERPRLLAALERPVASAFAALHQSLLAIFADEAFRARCREVRGEASCLILARKGTYLWWFSVGDCLGYLRHWETARLGQFVLNARVFFQWIGQHNTFDEVVPGYSSGTQRLYPGESLIALSTDGVFESIPAFYDDPAQLLAMLAGDGEPLTQGIRRVLAAVHHAHGRDSATVVAWRVRSV